MNCRGGMFERDGFVPWAWIVLLMWAWSAFQGMWGIGFIWCMVVTMWAYFLDNLFTTYMTRFRWGTNAPMLTRRLRNWLDFVTIFLDWGVSNNHVSSIYYQAQYLWSLCFHEIRLYIFLFFLKNLQLCIFFYVKTTPLTL